MFPLQSHPYPQDLPSFPTRRSSDLKRPSSPLAKPCEVQTCSSPRPMLGVRNITLDSGTGEKIKMDQDRKSTRLNSSHSQISYAVFCLKKKRLTGGLD